MISDAFKSAASNEIQGQAQQMSTTASGVKSAVGGLVAALGFAAGGGFSGLAEKTLAGLGGSVTMATASEKQESAQKQEDTKKMFKGEEVVDTIKSTLGDNPINRSATKQLSTVFDLISKGKEAGIINKKGEIESPMGNIPATSELGKKLLETYNKEE